MADFLGALSKLVILDHVKCVYCGRDVPNSEEVCGHCHPKQDALLNKNGFFGSLLYVFNYDGIVRKLIHNFKYNDMPYLGAFMAAKMHEYLIENNIHSDLITFVPIHQNRFKWRGFDQSEMLASYLSAQTGIQSKRLLVRSRDTAPQFDLSRAERKQNVKGAFCAAEKLDVAAKRVLLVDDICTTGSTLQACSRILEKAGAIVIPFTYAREN